VSEISSAAVRPWGLDFVRKFWPERPPITQPIDVEDVETARRALRKNNLAIIRAAVSPQERDQLFSFAHDRLVASGDPGNNLMHYISSPTSAGFETTFWLIRSVINRRVAAIASAYFKKVAGTSDFMLPLNNLLIRQFDAAQSKPDLLVPYHQDGGGLPTHYHMINCWTLLYPDQCGTTSPGLEFCPAPLRYRLDKEREPTSKHYGSLESDYNELASLTRRYGAVTPTVAHGDILMFNELALHRTSTARSPTMTNPRVSAEIRLVAANPRVFEERERTGQAFAVVSGNRIEWPSLWQQPNGGLIVPVEFESAELAG
jgi:hypothetical protein